MKINHLCHLLITSLLVSSVFAEIDNTPPPPEISILKVNRVKLPLDSTAPRPTIKAKINGKGPFLFVLDTGA